MQVGTRIRSTFIVVKLAILTLLSSPAFSEQHSWVETEKAEMEREREARNKEMEARREAQRQELEQWRNEQKIVREQRQAEMEARRETQQKVLEQWRKDHKKALEQHRAKMELRLEQLRADREYRKVMAKMRSEEQRKWQGAKEEDRQKKAAERAKKFNL